MIHWRKEGSPLRQGLNVYRLNDKHSFGFWFRAGNFISCIRYGKQSKKWFLSKSFVSKLDNVSLMKKMEK